MPAKLLPTARFAATNHYATTGQPITADELAARLSLPTQTARRLLDILATTDPTPATPTPTPVNGAPVTALTGGAR
jgi:predicted ArsR family transcriptional regulator